MCGGEHASCISLPSTGPTPDVEPADVQLDINPVGTTGAEPAAVPTMGSVSHVTNNVLDIDPDSATEGKMTSVTTFNVNANSTKSSSKTRATVQTAHLQEHLSDRSNSVPVDVTIHSNGNLSDDDPQRRHTTSI